MAPHLRPRPNSLDELPEECEGVVAWAAQELANTGRKQTDIYAEFKRKLIAIQGELGLAFDIPHFSSFNRFNARMAKLAARQRRVMAIAHAVNTSTDGSDADTLNRATVRMLRTLIAETMENAGDEGLSLKEANNGAAAIYRLAQAENISSSNRQKLQAEKKKIEDEIKAKADKALDILSNEPGISAEAIARARREFLGVRPQKKEAGEAGPSNG